MSDFATPAPGSAQDSYTINDLGTRLLIFGASIPVTEFAALGKVWDERGLTVMLPGVAHTYSALLAICTPDEVDAWEAEARQFARMRSDGDPELLWLYGPDVGCSSLTIFSVLNSRGHSMNSQWRLDIPHDPDDFGRCYRLLNAIPGWRERLPEVAAKYPRWKPYVAAWEELTRLFEEESPSGKCPKLYQRMQEL